jgi:hypothetical protein
MLRYSNLNKTITRITVPIRNHVGLNSHRSRAGILSCPSAKGIYNYLLAFSNAIVFFHEKF